MYTYGYYSKLNSTYFFLYKHTHGHTYTYLRYTNDNNKYI